MLRRKVCSALKLLRSDDPIAQIICKIGENWREWIRQIRIINKCVADREGEAIFQTDSSFSERSSIQQFVGDKEQASGSRVPCVRLDSLLDAVTPAMVKLDIEGAEPMALRGGSETISDCGSTSACF